MKKIKELLKRIVKKNLFLFKIYLTLARKEKHKLNPIYRVEDINHEYYDKVKNIKNSELEHQIGRLINFRKIIKQCRELDGEFIEFGTWRGFSMLWIAYFMQASAIFGKKFVGLDGFIGLPYQDGVFDKFAFSDTSLKSCRKNIYENDLLYDEIKKNIIIEKFLYKNKLGILNFIKRNNLKKFCFIHIDCDVSQSAKEIFSLLLDGNMIANKAFILFDDYGCDSKLKESINMIFKKMESKWIIQEHSKTILTKNFYLEKIN